MGTKLTIHVQIINIKCKTMHIVRNGNANEL